MKATWIIDGNKTPSLQNQKLLDALTVTKQPHVYFGVDSPESLMRTAGEYCGNNLLPYGSVNLVRIAQEKGWKHLYFDEDKFKVSEWIKQRGEQMLNHDSRVGRLCDVITELPNGTSWFGRPLRDMKDFAGFKGTAAELRRWADNLSVGDCSFDNTIEVAIASVKNIQMEWRYFIVDRKIITGSTYRFKGGIMRIREGSPDVLREAQELAYGWLPHETCVMDLALCDDKVKIVEFNGINASGFYDHDINAFVLAMSKYAEKVNDRSFAKAIVNQVE